MRYSGLLAFVVHLCVWSLLLLTPLWFLPDPPGVSGLAEPTSRRWLLFGAFFLTAGLFYLNLYILIPRVGRRYGRWPYALALVGAVGLLCGAYAAWKSWVLRAHFALPAGTAVAPRAGGLGLLLLFVLALLVSGGLWLLEEWQRTRDRLREREYQLTQAELNQLREQLNPHFLFNTLHGIHALALEGDNRTPRAILMLSRLLDYGLSGTGGQFVPLEQDVSHLLDYVALHQLRLTDKTRVTVERADNLKGHSVAPLLLLPFVENAFKYGVSTSQSSYVEVGVSVHDGQLRFRCANRWFPQRKPPQGHALGVTNVERRLKLLYPGRHQLRVEKTGDHYRVELILQLTATDVAQTPAA